MNNQEINKIDGASKSVRELLSGMKYSIDYYQREYKWESRQIEELIDDLESKFLGCYEVGHPRERVQQYANYFLGSIVISKKNGKNFIIDGQQRLTSLTLLLIFLNNLQKDRAKPVDIRNLIFSEKYGKKSFNLEIDERVACMEALYSGQRLDLLGTSESVQNIIQRYEDIESTFPESISGDALPYFVDWLTDNVRLVEISTYNDDDAYTIFETMNDRGLSLSPTDMLKGYLLASIEEPDKKKQINTLWKARMLELSTFGKETESDFFKSWLRAKYAETIRERKKGAFNRDFDRIGVAYHKWVREEKKSIGLDKTDDFYDFVANNFNLYSKVFMLIKSVSSNFDPKYEHVFYNASNHFTLQDPILLAPINPSDDELTIKTKINLVAGYLDIYIFRRVINYRTLGYSAIQYSMFNLIKEIRGMDKNQLCEYFTHKVEDMEEKMDAFDTFMLHHQNRSYVHHILARITHYVEIQSNMNTNFIDYISKEIKKPYEIEHIWSDVFDYHKDEFEHEPSFKDYRNRIGGLILIPENFNQSYNAAPYVNKIDAYNSQNLIARSLHPLCYVNNPSFTQFAKTSGIPFRPHKEFKKSDLDERQKLYKRICEQIWSGGIFNKILDNGS